MSKWLIITAALVSVLLYSTTASVAQSSFNPVPNIMSPDAASLGKYGSFNVNYYTGVPDISIPLHSFNENGIDVSIALSYDAGGFIPNKNAGIVGHNWNLIAGGAITRIVNGVPDEKYNPNTELYNTNIGYIYGQQHALGTYSPEYIRTIQFLSDISKPVYNLNYEYIPDVFCFNFLGHSGRFFMDNAGQIQVASDRNYKVDLTNFTPQYDFLVTMAAFTNSKSDLNNKLFSQIVMTSDDGYTFYFGGSIKTLEIGFSSAQQPGIPDPKGGQINAWYLTKVVSPDGNEILFNYRDYSDTDLTYFKNLFNSNNGSWRDIAAGFMELKLYRNHMIVAHTRDGNPVETVNTQQNVYASLVKHAYLSEIKSRTQTIKFEYAAKDLATKFYGDPNAIIYSNRTLRDIIRNLHTQRLISIGIQDNFSQNDAPLKEINLFQDYYGNRMFLKQLQIAKTGNWGGNLQYGFTYNNTANLPVPLTRGIDLWGFYNGRDGNTDLVVPPAFGSSPEFETNPAFSGAYRLADPAYAKYGLLNTITYPTGGTTQFTFEGNTYSKVLKKKVSRGITPEWDNISGTAGGLRIQEIKNTPGTTTTYKYIMDYEQNENNTSSGLLTEDAIYYLVYEGRGERRVQLSDNNIATASSYRESPISYREVVEINSEGFTKYKFTNHITNADQYYLGSDSYKISDEASTTNFNHQLKRLYRYSSREDERGMPWITEVYNASKVKKKSVEYVYNTDPQRDAARTIAQYSPYSFVNWDAKVISLVQSYALFHYHNQISKLIERDYSSNNNDYVEKVTTYKYKSNTNRLLSEKTVTQSNGDLITNKYKYPDDFGATAPYNTMVLKYMLNALIEDQQYKGGTQFIRSTKTNYSTWQAGAIIKPSTVEQTIGAGQPEVVTQYTDYDNKGNLLTVSKHGSVNPHYTSYIWDYNQRFPVAEIVNAGGDQIAYTSFENAKGNWNYTANIIYDDVNTLAGLRFCRLGANDAITRTGLQSGTIYILSYWTRNATSFTIPGTTSVKQGFKSNGWTCFEHTVTGQNTITLTGSGDIDELRLYPAGSIMTTYTWSGMGSMTTSSDSRNRITYYEYDGLERLNVVRDQDRNVIKRLCYNYAGQPEENCAINTSPNWQPNGNVRCAKDAANNNTGYQEREEVDINPYSSSHTDPRWVLSEQNCTACPMPPTWTNTANTKCEKYDAPPFENTGRLLQEQKNTNSCSFGFNDTRWVFVGCSANCPNPVSDWGFTGNRHCVKDASNNNTGEVQVEVVDLNECGPSPGAKKWVSQYSCTECATPTTNPNWQPTGIKRCVKDASNSNTGAQEHEEKNMNPCSFNFGDTRWIYDGQNCTTCPITNCTGVDRKVINCRCDIGVKNYISSQYVNTGTVWRYKCKFYWCFSDGTINGMLQEEYSDTQVKIGGACLE